MTREQIKKIVKLTESIVNKRLNESNFDIHTHGKLERIYTDVNNIAFKLKNNYEVKSKLLQVEKLLKDCLTLLS